MTEKEGLLVYEDELIAALQEAYQASDSTTEAQDEPHTITTPEAQKKFQLSRRKTKDLLDKLCDDKILKRDMIGRVTAWGYLTRTPGYKLVKSIK